MNETATTTQTTTERTRDYLKRLAAAVSVLSELTDEAEILEATTRHGLEFALQVTTDAFNELALEFHGTD